MHKIYLAMSYLFVLGLFYETLYFSHYIESNEKLISD
jgi:hypothetical protein